MLLQTVELVVNSAFGGFSFDTEMALWLIENKGWTSSKENSEKYDLVECGSDWYYPSIKYTDAVSIRFHPDLIACVRGLQKTLTNVPRSERYKHHVLDMTIVTVDINIGVIDYHDGKERVECYAAER